MSIETIAAILAATLLAAAAAVVILLRIPKKLKTDQFMTKWKELQAFCRDKKTWPDALSEADKLLDKALKKRKFKGKTMGERLVSAQKLFSDNDSTWYAHNLYKKVVANDPKLRLKESDVRDALIGFRQALRDLGALPDNKNQPVKVKK